jgi:hypothetical protein
MTLEQLISKYTPEWDIYFSGLRYNFLSKDYTLAAELKTNEEYTEIEFFTAPTIELVIEQFQKWADAHYEDERMKMEKYADEAKEEKEVYEEETWYHSL